MRLAPTSFDGIQQQRGFVVAEIEWTTVAGGYYRQPTGHRFHYTLAVAGRAEGLNETVAAGIKLSHGRRVKHSVQILDLRKARFFGKFSDQFTAQQLSVVVFTIEVFNDQANVILCGEGLSVSP